MTKLNYLGSTLQSDGGMNAEVKKRILCVLNNWRQMPGVLCDKDHHHTLKLKFMKYPAIQTNYIISHSTTLLPNNHIIWHGTKEEKKY